MLRVQIKKQFEEFSLDISLEHEQGCLGILGASGSGKSMTLKCLSGIEQPDEGYIIVNDRVLFDSEKKINLMPQQRRIGYMFQNYALFPNMTVEENIRMGVPDKKARKQEAMRQIERFGLIGLEKHYPGQLSGGQQQRVALARMMACEPELILLDEPFSAMDGYVKEKLQQELKEYLKDYKGEVLLVSHNREDIRHFCSDIVVIDEGSVLQTGGLQEILRQPLNDKVARLTGRNSVSLRQNNAAEEVEECVRMELIATTEAEGAVLCHDITQIIRGVTKDVIFRKGHVVTKEDIPELLRVGKDHLYVWKQEESILHENEAAEILCRMCKGFHMRRSEVKEGKIELFAEADGLLKVDREGLKAVNNLGQMMIATRHGNFPVKKGEKVAGTRIIPLVIEKAKMEKAERIAFEMTGGLPLLDILPFRKKKTGIVTTGNEVFYGRIQDTFTAVIEEKLKDFDADIIAHEICPDADNIVTEHILAMIHQGAELILCTGGMSVDPDDKTPLAIKNTGADIVSYGAPVLPGAMFLLAYYHLKTEKENRIVTIVGLPGCVMYAKRTVFDLVLPRIMADDMISKEELAELGEGGLCLNCDICTFPNCGFGKGK